MRALERRIEVLENGQPTEDPVDSIMVVDFVAPGEPARELRTLQHSDGVRSWDRAADETTEQFMGRVSGEIRRQQNGISLLFAA